MEGKMEQEVELNNLLEEIPKATFGNPHAGGSYLMDSLENSVRIALEEERKSPLPATFAHFYRATQAISTSSNAALSFGKPSNSLSNSDEQSLTSAIADLNFKDGMTMEPEKLQWVNHNGVPNHTLLLEEQYTNCLKKSHPPSLHSPNSMNYMSPVVLPSNGHDRFNVGMNDQENVDFLKLDNQVKMQKAVSYQPLGHQTDPPRIPSSVPSPGFGLPVGSYQHLSFSNLQYPHPQMQSQGLSQSHVPWLTIEEEQYFRMHHKYLHLQQLQNQPSQARNPIHASVNATSRLGTWNMKQACTDKPFSHQYEHLYEENFQNNDAISRGFNCSGPTSTRNILCRYYAHGFCGRGESCPFAHGQKKISLSSIAHPRPALSAKDFDAIRDLGKVGKPNFPVKILTRKKSLNPVKAVKFNSIEENESLENFSLSTRVLSNGHLHQNAPILSAGLFQLDGRNFWDLSPDTKDGRHDNQRLQPQKFNSVDEVAGKIYFMAKDQCGCRFLQRKLSEATAEDVEKIFLEIVYHIVELMTHPFGNYLVQKLLEACNEDQRTQIVYAITHSYIGTFTSLRTSAASSGKTGFM